MPFWKTKTATNQSGAVAGTCTDLFFFPIDTLKTRLQAKGGFFHNGGWKGVYKGVGSTIVASAPGASLFFLTYEEVKARLAQNETLKGTPAACHMIAASLGEIAACSVRVPAEVIKQRVQTSQHRTSYEALVSIFKNTRGEGVFRGLYRGWGITIMREIPFTAIQFPLYEMLRKQRTAYLGLGLEAVTPQDGAIAGAVAGGTAAALTTPLDVIKTRIMLHHQKESMLTTLGTIYREEGMGAFWRGIGPRTMWISTGGAVFLGVYELARQLVPRGLHSPL